MQQREAKRQRLVDGEDLPALSIRAHVIATQRAAAPDGYVCEFVTRLGDPAIPLMAALYPPADSDREHPMRNVTSRAVGSHLGVDFLNWVDICLYASVGDNSGVDQQWIERLVTTDTRHATLWMDKITTTTTIDGTVVYVAGVTANIAWAQALTKRGRLVLMECVDLTVCRYTLANGRVITAVEGAIHPSAHMMAGGAPQQVDRFKRAMSITRSILAMTAHDRVTLDPHKMSASIGENIRNSDTLANRRLQQARELLSGLDTSCLGTLPWHSTHVYTNITALTPDLSATGLINAITKYPSFVAALATDPDKLLASFEAFSALTGVRTPAHWTTAMCGSLAAALATDPDKLLASFEAFSALTGVRTPAQWTTAMCDSLVAALADRSDHVLASVRRLDGNVDPRALISMFGHDSVASRLLAVDNAACLKSVIRIARVLEQHGLDDTLVATIIGNNGRVVECLPYLVVQLDIAGSDRDRVIKLFDMFCGSYKHKSQVAVALTSSGDPWAVY
jgi:hypothetical protein